MELFWDMLGATLVFAGIFVFWIYTKDAMDTYKKNKREERIDTVKNHPILASVLSGLVAWKAFDIWNKSREAKPGNEGRSQGRSVYEDLNLD